MITSLATAILAVACQSSPLEPPSDSDIASVEVAPSQLETRGGRLARFEAVARSGNGSVVSAVKIDWTTTNSDIAIVDSDGYVWSFKEGTTTATASAPGKGHGASNGNAYGHVKKDAQVQVTELEPNRPGRVTDLAVTASTSNSVSITFTEVDDGTGDAAEYLLRFESAPLDWGTAEDVVQGSCSTPLYGSSPGSRLSCSVEGLTSGTTYDFQIIAIRQDDGVYGDLSNVATGTTESSGSGEHPNEPSGLTRIAQHGFSCMPGDGCSLAGEWKRSSDDKTSIVDDPSAPDGDGKVARLRFPSGGPDGQAYTRFDGWGPAIDFGAKNSYDEVYITFWLKVEGTDYENQTNGTKVFYLCYGTNQRCNQGFLQLYNGTGKQTIQTEMMPLVKLSRFEPDDGPGLSVWPNVNSSLKVQVGQWHRIELYLKINDIGPTQNNGVLRMWVDGTLTTDIGDWRYRSDEHPTSFYHMQFTPVWGGSSGDVRTRDDYWRIADMYMSGN